MKSVRMISCFLPYEPTYPAGILNASHTCKEELTMLYISNVFCVSFSFLFFFFYHKTRGGSCGSRWAEQWHKPHDTSHHSASLVGGDCLEQHLNSGRSELSAAGQEELGISIPALQSLSTAAFSEEASQGKLVAGQGGCTFSRLDSVGESKEYALTVALVSQTDCTALGSLNKQVGYSAGFQVSANSVEHRSQK